MDLVNLLNKASNNFCSFGSIGDKQAANDLFKLVGSEILAVVAGAACNNDEALLSIIGADLERALSVWCRDSSMGDGTLLSAYLSNKIVDWLSRASIDGRTISDQQHSLIRETFPVLKDRLDICKTFGIASYTHPYYTDARNMDSKLACDLLMHGARLSNIECVQWAFRQNTMFEVLMSMFQPELYDASNQGWELQLPEGGQELRAAMMFGVYYLQAGFFKKLPIDDYAALIHGEKSITEYRLAHTDSFMKRLQLASTSDDLLSLQGELASGLVNELTGQPYPFETASDRLSYLMSDAAITRELAKRFDQLCEQFMSQPDDVINAGAEPLFSALRSFFLRYQTVGLSKEMVSELSEPEQLNFLEHARKITGFFCFDLNLPHMNRFFIRYMQLTREQHIDSSRDADYFRQYYFVSRAYPKRSAIELFAEPLMDSDTLSVLTGTYSLSCFVDNISLSGRSIVNSIAECVYSLRKSAPERLSFIPNRPWCDELSVEQLLVQQFAAKSMPTTVYLSNIYESALDELHSREHNSALGDTFGRVMSQAPGTGPEFLNDMLRPTMV